MQELLTVDTLISFLSLTAMEIVLGIDNIIFISILTGRLDKTHQEKARVIGLGLALLMRIALLFTLTWLIGLSEPLFYVLGHGFSGRDLILIAGGIFLIYKSTVEIHEKLEGKEVSNQEVRSYSFQKVIIQIMLLDIVFSFDSILTAIGLVKNIVIMIAAVVVAMVVMLLAAKKISDFIQKHPTLKMLALSFLLMIGVLLFVEGFNVHVPKGYIYFAIFFSAVVETLNIKVKKRKEAPVYLKQKFKE